MIKLFLLMIFFTSCSVDSVKNEFRIFNKLKNDKKFSQAVLSLNKIIKKTSDKEIKNKALLEKADIYLNKIGNNNKLIDTYKELLIIAEDDDLKIEYSNIIADIYINKINKYEEPLIILNKLKKTLDEKKIYYIHKKLSEIYYYKKDYFQAELELKKYLINGLLSKNEIFLGRTFQADIYFHKKNVSKAIKIYESLIKEYPVKSKQNDLHINILGLYESEGEYKKAIKLVKKMIGLYPERRSFLTAKLARFENSIKNMPGAGGLRR